MNTLVTPQILRALLPKRPVDAHKGTFGHVFIVAGSRGFAGAAKLAAEAALRSGVGLVTLGCPETVLDSVATSLFEAMTHPLPATKEGALAYQALEPALAFAAGKQAIAIGPGISQHSETKRFVIDFVSRCLAPILIDADGLNCLSSDPSVIAQLKIPVVITPHPGEMARLLACTIKEVQADREGTAKRAADRFRCTVVLKGDRTVIAAPGDAECRINPTGNAGLAKGGTGDVLSGLIGGLLAQGLSPFDAAIVGVYIHGLAADIAVKSTTQRGLTARDVIHTLPLAWRLFEREG